jgi:hypothetical protein
MEHWAELVLEHFSSIWLGFSLKVILQPKVEVALCWPLFPYSQHHQSRGQVSFGTRTDLKNCALLNTSK